MIQLVFVSLLKTYSKIYQQVAHQFDNFFKERIFQKFSLRKKIFSEARKCAYQEVKILRTYLMDDPLCCKSKKTKSTFSLSLMVKNLLL